MTSRRHYLDHASTTPLRPAARDVMARWLEESALPDGVGDAGRVHEEGRRARLAVETARESVASLIGAEPSRVVFTSGGTEAANAAVFSAARLKPGAPLAAAAVEHSCVREACGRAGVVVVLPVDNTGRIEVEALQELLDHERPGLVNCQLANHETGTMQPVAEVVNLCMNAGTPVHIDAAAALGHVAVRFDELGADYVSVSSHKLGGPPGVGALVVRRGLRLAPLIVGGSEERARRAGAENVLGIVGFGAACAALAEPGVLEAEATTAMAQTSALLAAACGVSGVEVVGDPTDRVPHIACVAVGGVKGEAVLLSLDRAGIAVHSGSACSSEVLEPSPVLAAIGADPEQSLRMSVGWSTTAADVAAFAKVFPGIVTDLRALARR